MKPERNLQNTLPAVSRTDPIPKKSASRSRTVIAIIITATLFAMSYRLYYFVADITGAIGAAFVVCLFVATTLIICNRAIKNPAASMFLLSVESEASKISWLTWSELKQSAVVVLCCMAAFSLYLFCCDMAWYLVLNFLSIVKLSS